MKDAIFGAKALGFIGLKVTIPYKEVLKFVNPMGDAKVAVNTIDLRTMYGYNADIYGVEMSLKNAGIGVKSKVELVIGAGRAAKAIAVALLKMGSRVIITNRTIDRGIEAVRLLRRIWQLRFPSNG